MNESYISFGMGNPFSVASESFNRNPLQKMKALLVTTMTGWGLDPQIMINDEIHPSMNSCYC